MDNIQRDTMFAGLTDREIAESVVMEMRRRNLYGCLFIFPATGGPSVFGSSSPANTLSDYTAAHQLAVFSEVAERATGARTTKLADDLETGPCNGWVN